MPTFLTDTFGQLTIPAMIGGAIASTGLSGLITYLLHRYAPNQVSLFKRIFGFVAMSLVICAIVYSTLGALASVMSVALKPSPGSPPPEPTGPKFTATYGSGVHLGPDFIIVSMSIVNTGAPGAVIVDVPATLTINGVPYAGKSVVPVRPFVFPSDQPDQPPRTLRLEDFLVNKMDLVPRFGLLSGYLMYVFPGLQIQQVFRENAQLTFTFSDATGLRYTNSITGSSMHGPAGQSGILQGLPR